MIVDITQNKILIAAVHDANAEEFYRALCMFNRVDCYESRLNRIACCCGLGDNPYAVELYRKLKIDLYDTHNLYADLAAFGDEVQVVLDFCDADEPSSYKVASPDRISADRSKLLKFFIRDDDLPYLDLDYAGDFQMWDDPAYSPDGIYDINSKRYFDSIRFALEKAYDSRDFDEVEKQGKRLLALNTHDPQTLEAQIAYCLYTEKYTTGAKYAKRVSELTSGYTQASVGGALEILSERHSSDPKKVPVLRKLLAMAQELVKSLTITDLQESIYYASSLIHDHKMAYTFAKRLFSRHDTADLQSLKMCAIAFWNVGEVELARQAAAELLAAIPNDLFALGLLKYITTFNAKDLSDVPIIPIAPRYRRQFMMPKNFAAYAQLQLLAALGDETAVDFDDFLLSLELVTAYTKTLLFQNDVDEFIKVASLLRTAVRTCAISDVAKFTDVSKTILYGLCGDCSVAESFLARLIELGLREKVFVTLPDGSSSRVDLTLLPTDADAALVDAFSIAATMESIKINRFLLDYERVKSLVANELAALPLSDSDKTTFNQALAARNDGGSFDLPLSRELSYCLLCMNMPRFVRSPLATVFSESEKELYRAVKKLSKS